MRSTTLSPVWGVLLLAGLTLLLLRACVGEDPAPPPPEFRLPEGTTEAVVRRASDEELAQMARRINHWVDPFHPLTEDK